MSEAAPIRVREHGTSGPVVIVIHGGPGAAGDLAPVARGLADRFRVLEPWQRGSSGDAPLTVAQHVDDLHGVIKTRCGGVRPALVGHSWGAMLALVYAAHHPDRIGPLVIIGCGTFDKKARAKLRAIHDERMSNGLRRQLQHLPDEVEDPCERSGEWLRLILPLYSYDPIEPEEADEKRKPPFDEQAHTETWDDMIRLQEDGVYPGAFEAIRTPVLMLHGSYDPHPGEMIRDGLNPLMPQLEYRQWEKCGHTPWLERAVRDEFFIVMREWLGRKMTEAASRLDRQRARH